VACADGVCYQGRLADIPDGGTWSEDMWLRDWAWADEAIPWELAAHDAGFPPRRGDG
jgi:hypothetical protein